MNWKIAMAVLGGSMFLSGYASALTLQNNDSADYDVEVIAGQGDASTDEFVLGSGETKSGFCEEGCVVKLSTGAERHFVGDENVSIVDGDFVIAE